MQKKTEKFLQKIVQKDYNNQLEKVLETKDFDENVKNLLLEILYKIDVSYKDYKKVKRNVETKQEYTEKIIKIIENNCYSIKAPKPNSKDAEILQGRTFLVDTENKSIICYPIERKLLYSIAKIAKKERIIKNKYFLIDKTLSDAINIGNNINTVEPLRDFNGWSWLIIKKEIENLSYNLIYQNLRILLGEEFLNSWVYDTENLIDYYEELENRLSEQFGKDQAKSLICALEKISILLEIEINPAFEEELKKLEKDTKKKISSFTNKKEFVEKLTEEKRKITTKISKIEKILSSKEALEKELTKLNSKLPQDKKIFSIKVLEKQLKNEKQDLLEGLEEKNKLLNPKKFVEEKQVLEKVQELLSVTKEENKAKSNLKILEEIQKLFLQCFLEFVNSAETKDNIIDLIYIFRYYNLLPFDEEIDIYENNALHEALSKVEGKLIEKAIKNKILFSPSENIEESIKLLKFIFRTKIISIEDIYISVRKEKDKYYVELSEDNENTYEEKFEINDLNKDSLNIKLNKKNKILT